jgi:hypothetical protein
MRQHYTTTLLFTTLFSFFLTPSVFGQQCRDYACVIAKVEKLMKQNQKDYKAILDNLESAEGYPDSKAEQVRGLRRQVFLLIENEKNDAKRARDDAKKQTEIAKTEKIRADKAFLQADNARQKVQAVLDKIYFYDGKFGLAYANGMFGFIDKSLNTKIDFMFKEATPFDKWTGFAKVAGLSRGLYYLIDTLGNEYKLATDVHQLDSTVLALDLTNKEFTEIDPIVFKHTQLKLLLLYGNKLTHISSEIGQLTNLEYLDLSLNQLTDLPKEIGKLTHLTMLGLARNSLTNVPSEIGLLTKLPYLNLSMNKITKLPLEIAHLKNLKNLYLHTNAFPIDEQEKIKKLLPNCKIEF